MSEKTQVAVIGGGPGGYAAAFKAADLGLEVTLINLEENPGGVCLYRGCIPSKALLHIARVINEAKDAAETGVSFAAPEIDIERLRSWKEQVVTQLTSGLGQLSKARRIRYVLGRAQFTGPRSLSVERQAGGTETIEFEHAILATGSVPTRIPGISLESRRVMDSTDALALYDVPESLLVVGGGYIGLELGTVYAALGSAVSVVEMMPGILPGADRDLAKILAQRLDRKFHEVLLETKVMGLSDTGDAIAVKFEDKAGKATEKSYDKVLIAIGRRPNSQGLGLENTKVQVTDRGFVQVDGQRRTAEPSIYCIGDLAGEPMLAHKATHEGIVAAEAIAGHKTAFEPRAIPAVVFTDPEIAWAGITEAEAFDRGNPYKVVKFPWGASGRATAVGRTDGLTKLIVDPESDRLLGVGICGVGAGEMIAEGVLAIEMAALASDLKLSIHPHPTLTETMMEAGELYYGSTTHIVRPKK